MSDDALDVLNERVPLARLIAASRYVGWPASLRANARLAALARALLLDAVEALAQLEPASGRWTRRWAPSSGACLRDNWWCALSPSPAGGGGIATYQAYQPGMYARTGARVDPVTNVGAPDYFAPRALAWASAQPDDPRVAEALHLAVRATRYGCSTNATADLSRQAFTVLHTHSPEASGRRRRRTGSARRRDPCAGS